MPLLQQIGYVTEIGGSAGVRSLQWRMPGFSSLPAKSGDWYRSISFSACDGMWLFQIYPNGTNQHTEGWVDLHLCRVDRGPPQIVRVTVGVKTAGGLESKKEICQEFANDGDSCCWRRFFSRSQVKHEKSRWMPGDVLTLSCDVKRVLPSYAKDSSTQTVEDASETEEHLSSEKQGMEKFVEDMGKLLVSGQKSDVTVQVKEAEFKVHSNILSARCPVLTAMLEHDMAEKASNRISINDCEPDVFEEYLRYVYTGSFKLPSQRTVFGLYTVADKYLAEDLKLLCLKHIRCTLCVETFCEAVKLALTHGESDLFQSALDFASQNIQSIIISVEWQEFICENPRVANEILIECFGPRR